MTVRKIVYVFLKPHLHICFLNFKRASFTVTSSHKNKNMKNKNLLPALLSLIFSFASHAQTLVKTMSSTNGTVYSVTNNAGIYYIGGSFTYVGLETGTGGLITSSSNDLPIMDFPVFTGDVRCAVSDGSNGWYVGGSMYQADGISCSQLVHVLSDNTIDPAFNANITSGTVYTLDRKSVV